MCHSNARCWAYPLVLPSSSAADTIATHRFSVTKFPQCGMRVMFACLFTDRDSPGITWRLSFAAFSLAAITTAGCKRRVAINLSRLTIPIAPAEALGAPSPRKLPVPASNSASEAAPHVPSPNMSADIAGAFLPSKAVTSLCSSAS
eukprot:1900067-Amphidinium_carterae.2